MDVPKPNLSKYDPTTNKGSEGALGKSDVVGTFADKINPIVKTERDAEKKRKEDEARARELYEKTLESNKKFNEADTSYKDAFSQHSTSYLDKQGNIINDWKSAINPLIEQSKNQANDQKLSYTNTILPEMKNYMGIAANNANSAMTLEEAMDPNNKVQSQYRELFNKLGLDANRQGQQDYGILSALGAQAAQGQFGASGPMTAGAMGQIYAQNQNQAQSAYAKAQQRMYDLQQQGIKTGIDQSNLMYDYGQKAVDKYGNTIKDYQDVESQFLGDQAGFRDEQGGYAGDIMGVDTAMNADTMNMMMMGAGIDRDNAYSGEGRDIGAINQLYGQNQQLSNNQAEANAAANAMKAQFISALLGAGSGALGSRTPKKPKEDSAA